MKNDIGFFGPVGWGAWNLSRRGVTVEPGDTLIATSEVSFSSWAIDILAETISADPGLRRWLAPRRVSFVGIDGGDVRPPGRPAQPVEPAQALVLPLRDGTRQPAVIAAETGLALSDVFDTLAGMAQRRWLVWKLDVPVGAHPDHELRAILERVGDAGVRDRALGPLAVLEAGKARVRAAVGDAAALVDALIALEADFVELTESAAQRAKGARTSANRALVYSDSRRTASATIGSAILDELAPLAMFLTAARWMTNRFARAARERIGTAYRELAADQSTVDLASLWMRCVPVPHPRSTEDIDRITDELRLRWQRIIDAPDGARRVRLSAADIADAVRAAFDEPGDGWNIARYVSPVVFVVADDAAAVERGDFELVVGELHLAMNTVHASLFVLQHPDPAELLDETDRDFPGRRMMPMLPREQLPRWNTRSRPALVRARDYLVGMVDYTAADQHRPRTLPAADVVVEDRDGVWQWSSIA
ncbi:lantibiotic dehydratase [Streptomyces sp. GSL17-111]|uniref:lantibiotic dehydratase n=1 Tax=Streptomyces sp. GSL17-111 TaxID=3121596 RepID=UPI0030F41D13